MKSEEGNKATFSHWPRLDTSQVFGSIQVIPQGPYCTQGPVFLNCLSTMVVKAGIVTGDTLESLLLLVGFWL